MYCRYTKTVRGSSLLESLQWILLESRYQLVHRALRTGLADLAAQSGTHGARLALTPKGCSKYVRFIQKIKCEHVREGIRDIVFRV